MATQNFISVAGDFSVFKSWVNQQATGRLARTAMKQAINATIKQSKPTMVKAVSEHYNIKKADITKTFAPTKKATVEKLEAKQVAIGKPIPLYKFGRPSPGMNKGWKRPVYYADVTGRKPVQNPANPANRGFVAAVFGASKVNGKNVSNHPGYIRTKRDIAEFNKLAKGLGGRQGHVGFFVRKPGVGFKPNTPIKELYSMGAPGGMLAKRTDNLVAREQEKLLKANIDKAMRLMLQPPKSAAAGLKEMTWGKGTIAKYYPPGFFSPHD